MSAVPWRRTESGRPRRRRSAAKGTAATVDRTQVAIHTQEPGGDDPDIAPPPEEDVPEIDPDYPESPYDPPAPPFTGEDVEDVGRPTDPTVN